MAPASASWAPGPRGSSGPLEPPALQDKLSLKALEQDIRRQVQLCHRQTQQDLDLLHAQVLGEARSAVAQDLIASERNTACHLRGELASLFAQEVGPLRAKLSELQEEVRPLRAKLSELGQEVAPLQARLSDLAEEGGRLSATCRELQSGLRRCEQDVLASREAAQELVDRGLAACRGDLEEARDLWDAAIAEEAEARRSDFARVEERLQREAERAAEREATVDAKIARLEGRDDCREIEELLDRRLEGLVDRTALDYCLQSALEEFEERSKAEVSEAIQQAQVQLEQAAAGSQARAQEQLRLQHASLEADLKAALEELRAALEGEAALGQARAQEAQAAVAELEQRVDQWYRAALRDLGAALRSRQVELEERVAAIGQTMEAGQVQTAGGGEQLRQLAADCRERLLEVQASWVRSIEWAAEVDVEELERHGKFSVDSPEFSAACLRGLRLRLRVSRAAHSGGGSGGGGAKPRWAYGAFLRAPAGQVCFRLQVESGSQDFSATFGEAPEMGSQRLAVLDFAKSVVTVRLTVLSVSSPLVLAPGWPSCLRATAAITDTAHAAAQEAAVLRSSMIRRVEWRIVRVAEHVAAVRAASAARDDEALEPLYSPQFVAAGLEGLQLRFYPTGYRTRMEEGACGLFLVCPAGVVVKCRAFVGDASKTLEHTYEEREPYGRGSFCRLSDKIQQDGSVVCGVEFLEVRRTMTTEVRGGAFGNVEDQVKLVSSATGGMDAVRELRELPRPAPGARALPPQPQPPSRTRRTSGDSENTAPGFRAPLGTTPYEGVAATLLRTRERLGGGGGAKSLPMLLPAATDAMGVRELSFGLHEGRRHFDL